MDDSLPPEINIVTLNCWGLKYISKHRAARLSQIGRHLAAAHPVPQIVGLQECWTQEDYTAIRRATRPILPYGKFYHGGAFGAGLAILSRWPIEESSMVGYALNGRPTAFYRGDWFVGKGVACARVRYGPGPKHVLEVFNTHTHAPYGPGSASYECHRSAQAWQVSKLLRAAAERGHLVLCLGDFNMVPLSPAHRLIAAHAPVRDAWRVLHPDSSLGPAGDPRERARGRPVPTAGFNIAENGATSNSVCCTWRWDGKRQRQLEKEVMAGGDPETVLHVPIDTPDPRGKRFDYIWAGTGDVEALGGGWVVKSARVGMRERHPGLGCSLSDHFSVEATLLFRPRGGAAAAATTNTRTAAAATSGEGDDDDGDEAMNDGTYLPRPAASRFRAPQAYDSQLDHPGGDSVLPPAMYDEILAMTHDYMRRETTQKLWRGLHFFVWVFVFVACLVGVWFVPHNYVAFVLMLVSSLGLTVGTVDGIMSILFFGSEIRALEEFEWEIANAKMMANGGATPMQYEEKGW